MDRIIPISDLRSNLASICRWVEDEKTPVYLTRNGHGRLVLIDMDSFEELRRKAGESPEDSPLDGSDLPMRPGYMTSSKRRRVRTPEVVPGLKAHDADPDEESSSPAVVPDERPKDPKPRTAQEMIDADTELSAEMKLEEERIFRELGLM